MGCYKILYNFKIFCLLALVWVGWMQIVGQEGQQPPYKLMRLVDFTFSESLVYDSNVFQSEFFQEEDVFLNHNFGISHSDNRPYFSYQFAYNLGYKNYWKNTTLDDDSHFLNAQIIIPRPYYTLRISNQYSITNEARSLEFNTQNESRANVTSVQLEYRVTDNFRLNFVNSYDFVNYPDTPIFDNSRYTGVYSFSYRAAEKWTLQGGYDYAVSTYASGNEDLRSQKASANLVYQLFRTLGLTFGAQYTVVNRTVFTDEKYYAFPIGVQIVLKETRESEEKQNLRLLQSLTLNASYSITDYNGNGSPFDFHISAQGYLSEKTTWNLTASRKLDFSTVEAQQQYQTNVALGISHIFSPDLQVQSQVSYQLSEYENGDDLEGIFGSISAVYSLTPWMKLQANYTYSSRLSQTTLQGDYTTHRISVGTNLVF